MQVERGSSRCAQVPKPTAKLKNVRRIRILERLVVDQNSHQGTLKTSYYPICIWARNFDYLFEVQQVPHSYLRIGAK